MRHNSPDLTFQPADTPAALATVRDLAHRIWPPTYDPILPPGQTQFMLEASYNPRQLHAEHLAGIRFTLTLADRQPVGFFAIGPDPDRPGEAILHKLYLLHDHHRRGIGSAMLRQALRQARAAGLHTLSLYVNRHNATAIAAYTRNGFQQRATSFVDLGNGFVKDDLILARPTGDTP